MKIIILIVLLVAHGYAFGSELIFTLARNGESILTVLANQEPIDEEKLDVVLNRLVDLNPNVELLIVVESDVQIGELADFLSLLSAKGLEKYQIRIFRELPDGGKFFKGNVGLKIEEPLAVDIDDI